MDENTNLTHFCLYSTTLHIPLLANSLLFNNFLKFFIIFLNSFINNWKINIIFYFKL